MDNGYFENNVVGAIREWFSETPYWGSDEEDYLPWEATAQGIAMNYFKNMDFKSLDLLGVEVVEGDDPGSPYYCAELCYSLEEANAAAEATGLRVRFVPQRGQGKWLANNYMCVPNKTVVVSGLRRPLQGIEEIMSN